LFLFLLSILTLLPNHDFHTSWMNFTYNEKQKEFEITWRTDTEHLEGVLSAFSGNEIHLENATVDQHTALINNYINKHFKLKMNSVNRSFTIAIVEVNFAETVVHFNPIKQRKKLRNLEMNNSLLIAQFPNQKNMFQLNYKGKTNSLLFDGTHTSGKLSLKNKN